MTLQKTPVDISFAGGLDLKTDPKRVPIGKFLDLRNTVFTKQGLLQKRNGFANLTQLPVTTSKYLTTFNDDLVAVSDALYAYDAPNDAWANKGYCQPVKLNTLSLIRSNTSQSQCDSVVSSNGLVCVTYADQDPTLLTQNIYKYAIFDADTGQNVVTPTEITGVSQSYAPTVYTYQGYFIILYIDSAGTSVKYIAISFTSLVAASPITYKSGIVNGSGVRALSTSSRFYVAYSTLGASSYENISYLVDVNVGEVAVIAVDIGVGAIPGTPSLTTDNTYVYVTYYDNGSGAGCFVIGVAMNLTPYFGPTSAGAINVQTSVLLGGTLFIYSSDTTNKYSGGNVVTPYVTHTQIILSSFSIVTNNATLIHSVQVASQAFVCNNVVYFLAYFYSDNQPTYFLIDQNAHCVAKLAYGNGAVNSRVGVTVVGSAAYLSYLTKTQVTPVNKQTGATVSSAIYAQQGVNLAKYTFNTSEVTSAEASRTLNLSGGFPWTYDGVKPVEQNFFTYPDHLSVAWTENSIQTTTGASTSGSFTILVASATGLYPGMTVVDTSTGGNIASGTKVASISGITITVTNATLGTFVADNLTFQGHVTAQQGGTNTNAYYYVAVYAWQDAQGNLFRSAPSIPIPVTTTLSASRGINTVKVATDRLTYKGTSSPVKIEIYRWSIGQPVYYQVTSVQYPTLNTTSSDEVTFVDPYSDSDIVGNLILYTTGGVIENIQGPPTSIVTLFQSRFWVVDAENPNTLWFSKQILQSAPIEMNDTFTFFVSPTIGAQGSTGAIKALCPMDDKLIVWKKNALYYINGQGPDNTGANNQYSDPIFINSTIGTSNPASLVFTPAGVMFESDKGIWILGRDLSTQYIGAPVETLTQGASVLSALNIPGTTQVRFVMSSGITLMYDYFYNVWGVFSVGGVCAALYRGVHTFFNSTGLVFKERADFYLDGSSPVLMSFSTSWISLAGLQGFERFYQCYLLGEYLTPFKLSFSLAYDYNPSYTQTTVITPQTYTPPYGVEGDWGDVSEWGGINSVFSERVFPDRQKCETFRVSVQEIFDSSFSAQAGAGLTLSGLNLVIGVKRGFRTQSAARSN